ncbi:18993_t:CDS:2 [Entrophospora sp. SA101]|nr:18993_t:CDS:2 [Entrophospora sp. SA101]CAJ0914677.1 13478_t:CDS:2 [Entrophospora sp. SA101]
MLPNFTDQLKPYEYFINLVDNKVMHKYLIPLTDLMVAANGLKKEHGGESIYKKALIIMFHLAATMEYMLKASRPWIESETLFLVIYLCGTL